MESENGSDVNSYDLTNSFAYHDGDWTMTAGNNASWGNGSTYQTTSVAFSGGNSSQSSLAETSYSYRKLGVERGHRLGPGHGTETNRQNGWSNSTPGIRPVLIASPSPAGVPRAAAANSPRPPGEGRG